MPSPISFEAISGLGGSALLVIAVWAFFTGRIRRESEVKDMRAEGEARLGEMRVERDGWKDLATKTAATLAQQTDVMESIIGKPRA